MTIVPSRQTDANAGRRLPRLATAAMLALALLATGSASVVAQRVDTADPAASARALMGIGGTGHAPGLSLALRTDTAGPGRGGYHHFQRGKLLPDGRIAVVGYEGHNHGGADGEDLFTMKQIRPDAVGVPLVLDGALGNGATSFDFAGGSPTPLIVYGTANDSAMKVTITGMKNVDGVPVAASETFKAPDGTPTYVRSSQHWWSGAVTVDRPSTGRISFGRQLAPSSVFFFMTKDGGRTRYNEFFPISGLTNNSEQGYQNAVAWTKTGRIVLLMYRNVIGSGAPGTVRRVNAEGGAPAAWGPNEEVLFSIGNQPPAATINNYRPIFYSEVFTRANGDLWTLLQGGPYTWSALSRDEGRTWHLSEWIRMARTHAANLTIAQASAAANAFGIDPALGNRTADFPAGRKFLIWNSRSAVHNGVYTVVRVEHGTQTMVTVAEKVKSDAGSGQINLAGVVGVDPGQRIFTIGGEEHASALAVGQFFNLNNSVGNNGLYRIVSLKAAGGRTLVGVSSAIPTASVSGRIQNTSLTEFGIGYLDQNQFIAICRTVDGGPVISEQFAGRGDPHISPATYVGRPKSPTGGSLVSSFITTTWRDGQAVFTWLFQGRTPNGPNPFSVSYRTAWARDALVSADAWESERTLVSTRTPLRTPDGDVLASATYLNHAYPFAVANAEGRHLVWFSLETGIKTADRYMLSFQPELPRGPPRRVAPAPR